MSRFVPFKFANQAIAQQVQISNRIKNLVLNEFVLVPQTIFVQYLVTPTAIALSILAPRARFRFLSSSNSCIKPKVLARLTSFTKEVLEKSIVALLCIFCTRGDRKAACSSP